MRLLVNRADDLVAAQGRYDALDLPPMAESSHIPVISAPLGPGRGLEGSIVSVSLDEVRSIGERHTAVNEEHVVHQHASNAPTVERLRTIIVNVALTMFALGEQLLSWHGAKN